ncbi:CHD5 domain containing protein [Ceratobasidium theobromae]|uniref:CHD5 domain containing protein n=1 Tax=Ceratobasidium theobromae TaxID=1582974 RepID=A0A5N5QQI7_9AGAM|nr:CHD5 domain containing protein [Ceratobasidium theobromae]
MLEQVVPVPSNEGAWPPCDGNLAIDGDSAGFEVLDNPDWLWQCEGDWVYVIDFDNYVFGIGLRYRYVYIKLDNMVPDYPGLGGYFNLEEGAKIPNNHLTIDVDLWPDTGLDASEVRQKYNDLQAVIVSPSEWGAPTWETLSISQQLSVCVLKPFVRKSAYTVGSAYFSRNWDNIEKFHYRVISIAAPSDIVCPPQAEAYRVLYSSGRSVTPEEDSDEEEPDRRWFSPRLKDTGLWRLYRPPRFRGCLIALCSRLDEPVSLMHEVGRAVEILRKSTHTRVGILISRWQIVAVAIHGSKVCHSPALDFNNGNGELCKGILLMMHLLSPLFTTPKTPWSDPPLHKPSSTPMRLPLEIIEYIIHLADFKTYLNLRSLSRTIRDLCLARPQVGQYTILGKRPGRNNVFKVQHKKSSSPMDATFTRIKGRRRVPCVGGTWDMLGNGEEAKGSDSDWEWEWA